MLIAEVHCFITTFCRGGVRRRGLRLRGGCGCPRVCCLESTAPPPPQDLDALHRRQLHGQVSRTPPKLGNVPDSIRVNKGQVLVGCSPRGRF